MNSNLTLPTFTYKDLLLKKLSYSVICSVLSQLLILQIYIFTLNFNPVHPVVSIFSMLATLTSVTTWLFVIPFLTIIFAQSVICAKDYVVKSTYCSTRFQKFVSVFSLHNLVLLVLHVVVGALLTWMFVSLGGGKNQSLMELCKGQNYCLNEGTFFLILSGFWTGFYFFIKVYISEKHLSFPVIQQSKFLQFKSEISSLVKDSIINSFWPAVYFVILYYIYGQNLTEGFATTFRIFREEKTEGFIIYLYLWMFSALYYFNMNLMRFFFNLFLTAAVEFPLIKTDTNNLTLQDNIYNNNWPIMQNLACLDLYLLVQWSKLRRQVFFTLSQPGGHPHNWNNLVENVLKLFTEYTELLNKSTDVSKNISIPVMPQTIKSPFQSPEYRFRNLRNMSYIDPSVYDVVNITQNPLPPLAVTETIINKLTQKLNNIWNVIKVVLGINFLFGELPQANVQNCLANGNLIIWTSQGIAELTCVSLVEDRYGIVQKDLPVIITSLVNLKQSLDKLNKVPALTRKIVGYDDFNYKMKGAVTMAVKRSLFNICRTFGNYLNDFPLSKDVLLYLQTYIMCKC